MNVRVIGFGHSGCASAAWLTRLNHTVIESECHSRVRFCRVFLADRRSFGAADRAGQKLEQIAQSSGYAIGNTRKPTSRPSTSDAALRLAGR